jgi:hypothetical protein
MVDGQTSTLEARSGAALKQSLSGRPMSALGHVWTAPGKNFLT